MEESRRKDQGIQELNPEKMEQVSGGRSNNTKEKQCDNCKGKTTWIRVNGVWVCGKCGHGGPTIL